MTNCKNCGAPLEPYKSKCPFCGTYYFDFTAFDMDSNKPVYVKFKTSMGIITTLAYPQLNTVEVKHDNIDCMDSLGHVLARFGQSTSCDLNVQFHSIPNKDDGSLFVLEMEDAND